jgi:hypothetical protein
MHFVHPEVELQDSKDTSVRGLFTDRFSMRIADLHLVRVFTQQTEWSEVPDPAEAENEGKAVG